MQELQSLQLPQARALVLLTQDSPDKATVVIIAQTNGWKSASVIIVNTIDFLKQSTLSKIKE